ncbi:hypothetical protein EIN_150030 [Entamoeba invadens IP1]|uniref:Serine-threonine-isoleucine rich protein n=1 Tax=Entamoeba invadens IP1 TaxID=370355 RepID=A0A0A1UEC6_ENTIV|nr:hypothetical protein EIN_150030 [Entamoeba invadens IP1]ELP91176.1 hypothetical protein EIN_150030 [Entamoeba invadens IP1]|eukprot:XP_004257947.1 hypothetical protein EIN_150030 [Entamoeba invadens IP1]
MNYASEIVLNDVIGNLHDDFKYTVSTTRTGFFLVSKEAISNTEYKNHLFSKEPKLYRYGTTENSHITCTLEGNKFEEYMCDEFAHDEMILVYHGSSFESTTLTAGQWMIVNFDSSTIFITETSNTINATTLNITGVFTIEGTINNVTYFYMKHGVQNRVNFLDFNPTVIHLLDDPNPTQSTAVFFYLSKKSTSSASWEGKKLSSFKVNSDYYRVTNLESNKYCTINTEGNAFVEPDCVKSILDNSNKLTLKYLGTSQKLPIVNVERVTFNDFEFNEGTTEIEGYIFNELSLTFKNVYLTNITVQTLKFTPVFVYGTCLSSKIASVQIQTEYVGYVLHDNSITISSTKIGEKLGKSYYRAMSSNNNIKNRCELSCTSEGVCDFIQKDCEKYATGNFSDLIVQSKVTKINNIPGDIRDFSKCDLTAAGVLEIKDGIELTCTNVDNKNFPLVIVSGKIQITSYTTSSNNISILSNLPTTLTVGDTTKFVWVHNSAVDTSPQCRKVNDKYSRCTNDPKITSILNTCTLTDKSYNFVDCDQSDLNTYKVDFMFVDLILQQTQIFIDTLKVNKLTLSDQTSCSLSSSTLVVHSILDVAACDFFNIAIKTENEISLITTTSVNGYIQTDSNITLSNLTTINSITLLTKKMVSVISTEFNQYNVTDGTNKQYFYAKESTCTITGTDFETKDVCNFIINFNEIDIKIPTTSQIDEKDRKFKSIKNINTFDNIPINQPNLKLVNFETTTGSSAILKEADNVKLTKGFTLNISKINTELVVSSSGCYLYATTSIATIKYEDGIYFVGIVEGTTGTAISDTLFRYGKSDTYCTTNSGTTFVEYDCNAIQTELIPDFENKMTLVVMNDVNGITQKFLSCEIGNFYAIENIKCGSTTITSIKFIIKNSQLGMLTLNTADDLYRIIENSTISDISKDSSNVLPIFYASVANTISNTTPKLYHIKITNNHYRYYGKTGGDNTCTYTDGVYNVADCNSTASIGIDLTITTDNFDNFVNTFKNAKTTTTVTTITALKATTFVPSFSDNLIINALIVDILELPTSYKSLVINSKNTQPSEIKNEVKNGMNPLFVGIVKVPTTVLHVELDSTMNRYYTSTLGYGCFCNSTTSFEQWDCSNKYFINKKTFKCTMESIKTFTFKSDANEFNLMEITHDMTISLIKAVSLNINTSSYTLDGSVQNIVIGVQHKNGTFKGSFNKISTTKEEFNMDVMHYVKVKVEDTLPTLNVPYSYHEITTTKFRISSSDGYYCTYSGKDDSNNALYLEGDCVNSIPSQILKIDNVIPENSQFTTDSTPRTFQSIKTKQLTLALTTVKITSLTGESLEGRMMYTIGEVETFAPKGLQTFTLNAKVNTVEITYQVTDGIITGSVEKVNSSSFTSTHLFVLQATTAGNVNDYSTKIADGFYRISSTTNTVTPANNVCTLPTDTTKYNEFDCNLYAKNRQNKLKLVSSNAVVDLTNLNLSSFEEADLIGATQIKHLTVNKLKTYTKAITFSVCSIDELSFDSTLDTQYFFDSTALKTSKGNPKAIFVLSEKSTLMTDTNLHKQQISSNPLYYRVQQTSDNNCTLPLEGDFEEWDCSKYAERNPTTTAYLRLVSKRGTLNLNSSKIIHFTSVIFDTKDTFYTFSVSEKTTDKLWFDEFTFVKGVDRMLFDTPMKFTKLTVGSSMSFAVFKEDLQIENNLIGTLDSDFLCVIASGKKFEGPSTFKSIAIGSGSDATFARITKGTTLDCTYHSGNFKELDCRKELDQNNFYTFVSNPFTLNFDETIVNYGLEATNFASMKYTHDSTTNIFTLNSPRNLIFQDLTISKIVKINSPITVNGLVYFNQKLDGTSMQFSTRQLTLSLGKNANITVMYDGDSTYSPSPKSTTVDKNIITLYNGTQSGIKPIYLNKDSCQNNIYYFKTELSKCKCILKQPKIDSERSTYEEETADSCITSDSVNLYSLEIPSTINTVQIIRDMSIYSDLNYESANGVTFTSTTSVTITFNSLHVVKPISFGPNIKVTVTSIDFSSVGDGYLLVENSEGITLPSQITYGVILVKKSVTTPTSDKVCELYNEIQRRVFGYGLSEGCECLNQKGDCNVNEYSKYYNLKITESTQLTNNFKSLNIISSVQTALIQISSKEETQKEISTVDVSKLTQLDQLRIGKNIKIGNFKNTQTYTVFEDILPTTSETTKTNGYIYNSIKTMPDNQYKVVNCGDNTNVFYRAFKSTTDITCDCKFSQFDVDCTKNPSVFHLMLDTASNNKYTLSYSWKDVKLTSTVTTPMNEITVSNSGNTILVENIDFKLIATQTTQTIKAVFQTMSSAYIISSNVKVFSTDNKQNYPLFVSTDLFADMNYITCNGINRYFASGAPKHCDCVIQNKEGGLNYKDCPHHSTQYNANTGASEVTLLHNWFSLTSTSDIESSILNMGGKSATTIYIKTQTEIKGAVGGPTKIDTDGTNYVLVSTTSTPITVNTNKCSLYCVSYTTGISDTINSANCSTNHNRISVGNRCRCSILDDGKTFSETDCNHDAEKNGFDLYVTKSTQKIALSKTFNSLMIKNDENVELTSTDNQISFTKVEATNNIKFSLQTIISTLSQIKTNTVVTFTRSATITKLNPKTAGFVVYLNTLNEEKLTINELEGVTNCMDVVYSPNANIVAGNNQNLVVLNGKSTLRSGVCTKTDLVKCYFVKEQTNIYDDQFSTVNCPCDNHIDGDTTDNKCQIIVESGVSSNVYTLAHDVIATMLLNKNMEFKSNALYSIDTLTLSISTSPNTLTATDTEIVIKELIIQTDTTIIGNVNIMKETGNKKVTLTRNTKEITISTFQFSDISSTSTNGYKLISGTSSFNLNCRKCSLNGEETISTITLGNSNEYIFNEKSKTTITKLSVSLDGDLNELIVNGDVVFANILKSDYTNILVYPIVIANLTNSSLVTSQITGDTNGIQVMCKNLVVLGAVSSTTQICTANGYEEVNKIDNATANCLSPTTICKLSIESDTSSDISKNYDSVICAASTCTIGTIKPGVTKLILVGKNKSNKFIITEPPKFQIQATNCVLEISNDSNLAVLNDVTIVKSEGILNLASSHLVSITSSESVIINGDVIVDSDMTVTKMLTLTTGSLSVKATLTFDSLNVITKTFKALTVNNLTQSGTSGTISADKYYNHYAKYYTKCGPVESILTSHTDYKTEEQICITTSDSQIDINTNEAFVNHRNLNCKSLTHTIYINSPKVSCSNEVKLTPKVVINTVSTFYGNFDLSNLVPLNDITFVNVAHLKCVNDETIKGKVIMRGSGNVEGCSYVIHNSLETIPITSVPTIELINFGVFDLTSNIDTFKLVISNKDFDKTIQINSNITTLNVENVVSTANYVLINSLFPIKGGEIGSTNFFKCNNKKVVHGTSTMFSCDDFNFDVKYTSETPENDPAQGCVNSNGVNCIANVVVNSEYALGTLNLKDLNSKTIKVTSNVNKMINVDINANVESVYLESKESNSGFIFTERLPMYTTVKDSTLKVVSSTSSAYTFNHIVFLHSENSFIELNNLELDIWEMNCSNVKLNLITANIYTPIRVTNLEVSKTRMNVYESINIATLTVIDTYPDVALFTIMQNIENIIIENGVEKDEGVCKYIVDYLSVSVKPILSKNINSLMKSNRIYVGECSFALSKCTAVDTVECNIDVHENGIYQFTSVCPDSSVEIDLTNVSCPTSPIINGILEDKYYQITVPDGAKLQSSTTSPIEIQNLIINKSVTLTSPYILNLINNTDNLKVAPDCTLNINAHTQIVNLALKGQTSVDISQTGSLSFIDTIQQKYNLKSLNIKGNEQTITGPTVELSVDEITFAATTSTNSIINVNKFNLESTKSITFVPGVRSTHIPLINTVVSMTAPTKDFDNISMVCDSKTLIYNGNTQSAFQCPDDVLCTFNKEGDCKRTSLTTTNFIQRYIITIPSTVNDVIQLEDNSKVTKGYDVVNVKKSGAKIKVENGGIYVFNISASSVEISCADETAKIPCYVIINNLNKDSYGVVLSGKNMELKENTTIENLVANVVISGDITLSSFEVTSLTIRVKDGGIMRVKQYASMKLLTLEKNSTVYSSDSFDTDEVIYNGGQILIDADNTEAVLNVNIFNINNDVISLAKNECIHPITRKSFVDSTIVITVPELVWKGKVVFNSQTTMEYYDCSFSKLDLCGSGEAEHKCENIECDTIKGDSRAICYCTYNPEIKQDCSLACPITENTDCVFEPSQTSTALFNKITIPTTNTLVINKLFKFFVMKMSQNINIRATKSLNIYQITDEGENGAGTITIDSSADITIDSIRLTQSSSILTIKANALTTQELYVINGATLNINSEVTLPTSQSGFEFDTNLTNVPSVTRQIYFGKDAKINLLENAYFTIQGPTTKDQITNKFDATYNKMTLDECTVTLDADYIGKVTKNYPNVVFNFEVIGEVIINKATVMYKDKDPSNKNVTFILNNDVSHITTTEFSTKNVIDDQNYALIVGQSNAVLDKTAIPELSCDLTSEFSGKVSSETKWKRSQCPCNGETCIVNTESVVNTVNYEVTNITFAKYYTTNGLLEGTSANISELISLGGTTEVKVINSNIEMVTMEKKGIISFTKPMKVPIINGLENSGTIDVKTHSLTTKSITNVDLSISTGSILLEKETTGNFNGRTITVAASGRLDIYSSKIIFDDKTNFNVKVEAGQPALISVDDDALGDTLSITNAHYKVTIPSGSSGKIFTVLRVLSPINTANFEFTEDSTTPGGSVKTQLKSGTFSFKEACNGVVLTDLPNEQITCPEDRMARVVEKFEFPMYMIAVIIIFVLVLAVIVALLIAYVVHVYIVRKRNMKVFEEGEEIDVDEKKQDEEIKNQDNKPIEPTNEVKKEIVLAPVPFEVPLANDQKTTSVLDKTSESGSGSNSGSKKD